MIKQKLPGLILLLLLSACRTDGQLLREKPLTSFTLLAKTFNGESRACPGVAVTLYAGGKALFSSRTDLTGKALIPRVPFGTYEAVLFKEGFERVAFSFDYTRADQALYGRLYSAEQLLVEAGHALERHDWVTAEKLINRARNVETEPVLCGFYRAILLWKRADVLSALAVLEDLARKHAPLPGGVEQFLNDLREENQNG